MKLTYFVRSTTCDNKAGLMTVWEDGPLFLKGRQQAQEQRDLLSSACFDAVYASDSGRALDTAATVFDPEAPVHKCALRTPR